MTKLGIGGAVGAVLGLGWTLPPDKVALIAAVFALGIGAHALLDVPVDADGVASPLGVLRGDLIAGLWSTAAFATTIGVFYGMAFAFTNEVRFVTVLYGRFDLVIALVAGAAGAIVLGRFSNGRLGTVAYGLATTALGGMVFPRATSFTTAVAAGVTFGIAIGLIAFLSRASATFAVTRLWLAMTGRLPLRLMTFLDDAHRRGVLRQAGAVYQFRHARLADRLTSRPPILVSAAEVRP